MAWAAIVAFCVGAFGGRVHRSSAAADRPATPGPELTLVPVAAGAWAHIGAVAEVDTDNQGDVANLGVVAGDRCAAVIDTGYTPQIGARLRAAVERSVQRPICFVILTHAHPDHALGSGAFAGSATRFVASSRFNAALSARFPYFTAALQRTLGVTMTPAEIVTAGESVGVGASRDLDLGGRTLRVQAWPTAHTDSDLTVYDASSRTLYAGDLLFVDHLPVVDGQLRGWFPVMDALASIPAERVVPGHGPISAWPAALAAQRGYLESLRDAVRAAIRDHVPLSKAATTVAIDRSAGWRLVEVFHRRNVTAAYAELEWE